MTFESLALTGHVALVTGGSRGIGRAIVEVLARRGAAVAFTYREREEPARALVRMLEAAGARAWTTQCDVADEGQVQTAVAGATAALGPIDILVNNAGVTRDGYLMLMDRAKWDAVLRPNLDGAFFCTRAVVRGMLVRKWGRVISLTSPSAVAGLAGRRGLVAPTAGLTEPDPSCGSLGWVIGVPQPLESPYVLVNSFASGGTNYSVLVRIGM